MHSTQGRREAVGGWNYSNMYFPCSGCRRHLLGGDLFVVVVAVAVVAHAEMAPYKNKMYIILKYSTRFYE